MKTVKLNKLLINLELAKKNSWPINLGTAFQTAKILTNFYN